MKSGARSGAERESGTTTRSYRMTARAEAMERTRERIFEATYELWLERPYDEVTMDAVAERADVSRQTIHRYFGTKHELMTAVAAWRVPREDAARAVPVGDVAAAVHRLVERYEETGDAIVRALQIEDRIAVVGHVVEQGRRGHRSWTETVFAPYLPGDADQRSTVVDALYAATDVTVWKLLRRDFGYAAERTERIMRMLVDGVLAAAGTEGS